jgi:signal transduction histidine kinase
LSIEHREEGLLCVRDTSPGLSTERIEHAFERFFLCEQHRQKRTEGTGPGPAIVMGLFDAMHGEVSVVSEEGMGTTFCVELPQATGEAES